MERIYYEIGFWVVWVSFSIIAAFVVGFVFTKTLDKVSRFLKVTAIIISFAFQRKEWEEWKENRELELQEKRDLRKRISELEEYIENIYRQQ